MIDGRCKLRKEFSQPALIVRGLGLIFQFYRLILIKSAWLHRFQILNGIYKTGGNSGEATPVPIPNTAVKVSRADGSNAQLGVVRVGRCRSYKSHFLKAVLKMKITKETKKELSKKLSGEFSSKDVFFAAYAGLKFEEISALREKLKPIGSNFSVKRNTVITHGLEAASISVSDKAALKGPTAVVIIDNPDELSRVAKILVDYSKEKPSLKIKGGFVSKNWLTPADCLTISKVGSKKELVGKLANVLYSNLAQIRFVLEAPARDLAYVLKALEEKKAKESK